MNWTATWLAGRPAGTAAGVRADDRLKTGEVTRAVSYALTSLAASAALPDEMAALWRGHWSIENRRHYVRDVTLGEDACQMHTGQAPHALAALRNAVISLLRRAGLAQHCGRIASLQRLGAGCLTVHGCAKSWTLTEPWRRALHYSMAS